MLYRLNISRERTSNLVDVVEGDITNKRPMKSGWPDPSEYTPNSYTSTTKKESERIIPMQQRLHRSGTADMHETKETQWNKYRPRENMRYSCHLTTEWPTEVRGLLLHDGCAFAGFHFVGSLEISQRFPFCEHVLCLLVPLFSQKKENVWHRVRRSWRLNLPWSRWIGSRSSSLDLGLQIALI